MDCGGRLAIATAVDYTPYFLERNIGNDDDLAHDVLLLLPVYKPRPLPLPLLRIILLIL